MLVDVMTLVGLVNPCSNRYNHTPPPALTNMMSYFGASAYSYKPSGIVSYSAGNWGGVRSTVGLRSYLSELGK
jgi:NAD(P)H-dependent FMN reductase